MEDMMYLPYDVVEDINRLRDEEREHAQMISWLWADAPDDVPLSHTDDDETEEEVETVY